MERKRYIFYLKSLSDEIIKVEDLQLTISELERKIDSYYYIHFRLREHTQNAEGVMCLIFEEF